MRLRAIEDTQFPLRNLIQGFLDPRAVEIAVSPETDEPLIGFAGLVHFAAALVDLPQEVEAADIGDGVR